MRIFLDFETRSLLDVRDVGAERYAEHPSTTILCMAYAIGDEPVKVWMPGDDYPAWFVDQDLELIAHNAAFEKAIWANPLPAIIPADVRWHCTAARAAASGLPRSLEKVAHALGLAIEKDIEGKRLMMKHTKPLRFEDGKPVWADNHQERKRIAQYCARDVEVEREVFKACLALGDEERIWCLDQRINQRGIPVDVPTVEEIITQLEIYENKLRADLFGLTDGLVSSPRQIDAMLRWLQSNDCNIRDLQAATVRSQLARTDLTPRVCEALKIRQQLGRASVAKYTALVDRTCEDGRARGAHLYFGANTGRWAGRGIQTQNIPQGTMAEVEIEPAIKLICEQGVEGLSFVYPDPMQAVVSLIRPMIKAPEGKKLIVVDFAQIEARVLAWLAGQDDLIEQFRQGADPYKAFIAKVYGIKPDEVTKAQRQIGKIAILGLGYGMGAEKFQATAGKFGITLDEVECQEIVSVYREANYRIADYWKRVGRAAIEGQPVDSRVRYRFIRQGNREWLRCILPSGRAIPYYSPMMRARDFKGNAVMVLSYMHENSMTRQWERTDTYGGKLVENIVQGVARDILAEAMLRLEAKGHDVVMHVHDEVVVETEKATVEEIEKIVAQVPVWAKGCPIACEGFETRRYRK